jgi:hypothetical protein
MWKYKSVKTFERLQAHEPKDIEMENATIEEIDKKFDSYCNYYRNKYFGLA